MKRYCFALDLINNKTSIKQYIAYHKKVWPEILDSLRNSGIIDAEIYNVADRLFLILDTNESFTLEHKSKSDAQNPVVHKWEALMSAYQKSLPNTKPDEKWVLMERIFKL